MIKGRPGTSRNTDNRVVEKYFNELAISCPYNFKLKKIFIVEYLNIVSYYPKDVVNSTIKYFPLFLPEAGAQILASISFESHLNF